MAVLFLIFLDQIFPKWIKHDQTGFPQQSKNITVDSGNSELGFVTNFVY